MGGRSPVTLFPFLSVLISTMGVLSFIAVTFLMFVRQEQAPPEPVKPVEVRWVGAPQHVRPLLVECRNDGAVFHTRTGGVAYFFPLRALEEEVALVKQLERKGLSELGVTPDSYRFWLYMKEAIRRDERLADTLTTEFNDLELLNLSADRRRKVIQKYPILLVFPNGVKAYQLVSFLVETTTRLPVGLEPMLEGWHLPYEDQAS
jgi:hypothetical protein